MIRLQVISSVLLGETSEGIGESGQGMGRKPITGAISDKISASDWSCQRGLDPKLPLRVCRYPRQESWAFIPHTR